VEVLGWSRQDLQAWQAWAADQRSLHLQVFHAPWLKGQESQSPSDAVADLRATERREPLLGEVVVQDDRVRFQPRYPMRAGEAYVVVVRAANAASPVYQRLFLPPAKDTRDARPVTVVAGIFPSSSRLPTNLLKFYLSFSNPMSQGDVYRWIRLERIQTARAPGQRVELPFLEVAEELWDREGQRLTLLMDPARVKQGLVPREEDGPILEEGHRYRLTIDAQWPDGRGRPLARDYVKEFLAIGEDRRQPDLATWMADFRDDQIHVTTGESLDFALLSRCLSVQDAQGNQIAGNIRLQDQESHWVFTPTPPGLMRGRYSVRIDPVLEDLAGNSFERPFEVGPQQSIPASRVGEWKLPVIVPHK
jgi:hypothetical protein